MAGWTRRGVIAALAHGVLALAAGPLVAGEMPAPKGAVILTIAGDVANFNRGPTRGKRDGFFAHHQIAFERAFAFDRAMLQALPQKQITAQPPYFDKPTVFRGPLLSAVLETVGAEGSLLKTRALDGYAMDLEAGEIAGRDWIVALSADGRPLGIGEQGPVWLLHTPAAVQVSAEEDARWPWQVFFIQVAKP